MQSVALILVPCTHGNEMNATLCMKENSEREEEYECPFYLTRHGRNQKPKSNLELRARDPLYKKYSA